MLHILIDISLKSVVAKRGMKLSSKRKKRERKKDMKRRKEGWNKDNPYSHKKFPSPNKERDVF